MFKESACWIVRLQWKPPPSHLSFIKFEGVVSANFGNFLNHTYYMQQWGRFAQVKGRI